MDFSLLYNVLFLDRRYIYNITAKHAFKFTVSNPPVSLNIPH